MTKTSEVFVFIQNLEGASKIHRFLNFRYFFLKKLNKQAITLAKEGGIYQCKNFSLTKAVADSNFLWTNTKKVAKPLLERINLNAK